MSYGLTPQNAFSYSYDTDWWYCPKIELSYAGYFLIEAGELFRFHANYYNDDKMIALGQVLKYQNTKDNRHWQRKCMNCCKKFVNEKYFTLHRINGCGRTAKDKRYYEIELEQLAATGMGVNPPHYTFLRGETVSRPVSGKQSHPDYPNSQTGVLGTLGGVLE